MVARLGMVLSGDASIPHGWGELVSEVVHEYAQEHHLGPEHYDLWYHDEPLWFVRKEEDDDEAVTLGQRVQISFYNTRDGLELRIMPDAYVYDRKGRRVQRSSSPQDRVKGRQDFRLEDPDFLLRKDRDEVKRHVFDMIDAAFKQADTLLGLLKS